MLNRHWDVVQIVETTTPGIFTVRGGGDDRERDRETETEIETEL